MDIYKLTDEVGVRGDSADGSVGGGAELVITGLKQGVRNPERVNVYINGKYELSLDIAQVVDAKVKIGRALTEDELFELRRMSEFGKLYQRALEWALARPHSERETYDYLCKKIYEKKLDKEYINRIIEKLKEKKYISDEQFAAWWVENRFARKGASAKKLRMELMKKGVSKDIIDEVMAGSDRSDVEEIRKIIARKRARYTEDKLTAYLCRQGFPYDLVREMVRESSETD